MVEAISEVEVNDDGVRPIIVQFQNSELQEGEENKLQNAVFRDSKNQTTVAVATKEILYTGSINRKENQQDLYNRFLLISNRKTGKVRLVAVDTAILTAQLQKEESETVDNVSSMNVLNKQFGSKRIKKMTEQKERLKMEIDDIKEQLEQTVASINMDESELLGTQPNENDSMYRPPINREASTKEQVYTLNEMVPEHVLNSLEEEANQTLSRDLDTLDLNPFIKQHLAPLCKLSKSNRLEKCKLLLYLDYLLKYVTKPAKNITKRFKICESSEEVNSHILDNFSVTSNTGRTRPLSMRDKTICYILVLAMIALDYELDMEALAKNVKVGVKKLQEMGRILAFSLHGKSKNVMVLKIPLPPAVSISPKKRKR